jgi:hypothetical protein
MMLLRFLQLLLIFAVVRAVWMLLKGVIEGADGRRGDRSLKAGGTLARDPNCGTFVSPAQAPALRVGGEMVYFCSEKCRREWERR